MAQLQYRQHRKLMMRINQKLSSEEFNSLVYLMCVPDEIVEATQSDQYRDRTRILRYLEKQNIIGPHNYHCLVDALDTLGRHDLIKQITLEDPEGVATILPYIPQSFKPQQLAWMAKREAMMDRKEKYRGCMKDLSVIIHSQPARQNRFGELSLSVFSSLTLEQGQIQPCQESAIATLNKLSLFWKIWPTTLATFQQSGDSCKVKPLLSDCHSYFDLFNQELPPSWETKIREDVVLPRNKAQHPIGKLAREAHSVLHELSAELIGEQALKEACKRSHEALFVLESVNYTARYLIPIYKWLITLVHSESLSSTDASKMYATLKVLLLHHCEDIAKNRDILVGIVGEEVMLRISQESLHCSEDKDTEKQCDTYHDVTTYANLISSVSVVWHVTLIVLAMMSLNYRVDHGAIQKKLEDYMASQKENMMQTYFHLSKRMAEGMQKEVDHYEKCYEQKISQLVGGAPEPLEIVQSFFSYATD